VNALAPRYDKVIKGGMVIDGQMVPRRRADVAIKDGKVAEIGRVPSTDAAEVLDASGMIVAPGFVDLHTHYDCAFFYDPWCSLSGWHGVTSVAIGNCGFGFAPAREGDRDYLMRTLTRVEAIPREVMELSLPWTWESFPEWMDALDATPKGVNALTYVPLNPLLVYVMGLDAAKDRDATDEERAEMCRLLDEAMAAGACGWSAQRTAPGSGYDVQRDHDGTPFATDLMSNETAIALARVLRNYPHAFIQTLIAQQGDRTGKDPQSADNAKNAVRQHLEELAAVSDSAIILNAITTDSRTPNNHRQALAWMKDARDRGLKIYPQCVTSGGGFTWSFADGWNMFDDAETWRDATMGTTEERIAKLTDPARRHAFKTDRPKVLPVETITVLKPYDPRFLPAKNCRLVDAAKIMGYDDPIDLMLDMCQADQGRTLLQSPALNDDETLVPELVTSPFSLWGVSDGGAHQKFLTAGAFTTDGIIKWVREQEIVSLEEAHYRMSTLPAHCAGFKHRGKLIEGAPADVVVYDYENLTLLPDEVAYDLPGGDWRRIQKAEGYRYTIVNGEVTFEDGKCTEATPGRLLRHGEG
jgi:N-acyl-D-aspartate/D-glutamate deacylase